MCITLISIISIFSWNYYVSKKNEGQIIYSNDIFGDGLELCKRIFLKAHPENFENQIIGVKWLKTGACTIDINTAIKRFEF